MVRLSCQVSSSRLRTQARPAVCHPHNNDRNTEQNKKKKKQTNGRRDSVVSGVRRDAARQESVSRCNVDVGPCKTPPHLLPCQALVAAAETLAHHPVLGLSCWTTRKPTTTDRQWISIWHCLDAGLSAQRPGVVPPHSTAARDRHFLRILRLDPRVEASLFLREAEPHRGRPIG